MNAFLIPWFCFSLLQVPPQYRDACSKATEATTIQIGAKADMDLLEGYVRDQTERRVPRWTQTLVGTVYSITVKKSVNLHFPMRPLIDRVTFTGNPTSGAIGLTWELP